VKIEHDSMPTEIDVIERRDHEHEMERQALKKEKTRQQGATEETRERMAELKEKSGALKAEWQRKKPSSTSSENGKKNSIVADRA